MSRHTAGPWRYKEWGGLIVGGGTGSDEILICTMAVNTRHDEGRCNRELILAAPTMQAALTAERERADRAEAALECGHPASLMLHSAETGEPLYCELCDIRSQRNDAVQMEEHYKAERDELREQMARRDSALRAIKTVAAQYDSPEWQIVFDCARIALEGK